MLAADPRSTVDMVAREAGSSLSARHKASTFGFARTIGRGPRSVQRAGAMIGAAPEQPITRSLPGVGARPRVAVQFFEAGGEKHGLRSPDIELQLERRRMVDIQGPSVIRWGRRGGDHLPDAGREAARDA